MSFYLSLSIFLLIFVIFFPTISVHLPLFNVTEFYQPFLIASRPSFFLSYFLLYPLYSSFLFFPPPFFNISAPTLFIFTLSLSIFSPTLCDSVFLPRSFCFRLIPLSLLSISLSSPSLPAITGPSVQDCPLGRGIRFFLAGGALNMKPFTHEQSFSSGRPKLPS